MVSLKETTSNDIAKNMVKSLLKYTLSNNVKVSKHNHTLLIQCYPYIMIKGIALSLCKPIPVKVTQVSERGPMIVSEKHHKKSTIIGQVKSVSALCDKIAEIVYNNNSAMQNVSKDMVVKKLYRYLIGLRAPANQQEKGALRYYRRLSSISDLAYVIYKRGCKGKSVDVFITIMFLILVKGSYNMREQAIAQLRTESPKYVKDLPPQLAKFIYCVTLLGFGFINLYDLMVMIMHSLKDDNYITGITNYTRSLFRTNCELRHAYRVVNRTYQRSAVDFASEHGDYFSIIILVTMLMNVIKSEPMRVLKCQ